MHSFRPFFPAHPFSHRLSNRLKTTRVAAAWLALGGMMCSQLPAQTPDTRVHAAEARENALPLPEDRGAAALVQSLRRLNTWASLMFIVAHPDDEDGGLLAYESRGLGVRTSLLTLTRGEGGQNAMSADAYDALGVIRTNELLKADEYYGARQYWGTEADFGFSKTQQEAFTRWGHDRVLYDTVLAIRRERPLVLAATFVGGITDGHGQHQVSGEIAQEAFLAAGDPKVFPDQIAMGLKPWSPRKVYARVPFAPVTDKGMFDYATGKWAPAKFTNYVTKAETTTEPEADLEVETGTQDPVLGRSYSQIARQGWGEQKSQNGGANPTLSGGDGDGYHRYGVRGSDGKVTTGTGKEQSFFDDIPTGIEGMASLTGGTAPEWLVAGLKTISEDVRQSIEMYHAEKPAAIAPTLKSGYQATRALRDKAASSDLKDTGKADLLWELDVKLNQFQDALAVALGLDMQAYTSRGSERRQGPFGGGVDETPRNVAPGQAIQVKVHTGNATGKAKLSRIWLAASDGKPWSAEPVENPGADVVLKATVPADAAPTEPYFSRPTLEQPFYDVNHEEWRGRSFAPYPLAAWAEFDYDGMPIRMGEVVQTMQRVLGPGGILEPLVVTPSIGIRVDPEARILPLDGSPLPVQVTLHSEGPAEGKVSLSLPPGWTAKPAEILFHRTVAGNSDPILFQVQASASASKPNGVISIKAKAESGGKTYATGWQTVGYPGLRSYNMYRPAELKTRAVDVKVARGLRVGYVMGTGDTVPDAIQGLGITPHLLLVSDLAAADLSVYDVILIGIRAYSARPELAAAQPRLNSYVEAGGTLVVQYQSGNFPAPFPLTMGGMAERVVEEDAKVKILAPDNKLLSSPNRITSHDFDGWVEERGHSFLDTWDPAYTPLTETADAGQDPQRGGLLVAHPGKGTYIYLAYALYRQLPELVPGAYRILANLLSASKTAQK